MKSAHLNQLKDKLTHHFDFMPESEAEFGDIFFDLAAKSCIRNEAFLLVKSAVMYSFENNEYCFVKETNHVDSALIDQVETALAEAARKYVVPSDEHMSTALTGILLTSGPVDPKLLSRIERFRKQKTFLLGLRGWISYRLILIETESETVTASKEARKIARFYKPDRNASLSERCET